jgi:hypothetical protein
MIKAGFSASLLYPRVPPTPRVPRESERIERPAPRSSTGKLTYFLGGEAPQSHPFMRSSPYSSRPKRESFAASPRRCVGALVVEYMAIYIHGTPPPGNVSPRTSFHICKPFARHVAPPVPPYRPLDLLVNFATMMNAFWVLEHIALPKRWVTHMYGSI